MRPATHAVRLVDRFAAQPVQEDRDRNLGSAPSRHQASNFLNFLSDNKILETTSHANGHDGTKFRNQVLKPLLKAGWLEMTVPDKPTSRRQKYRTTDAGRQALDDVREPDA